MIDPTEPLQEGIVSAARKINFGAAIRHVEIYDEPPAEAKYPYIALSGIEVRDDGDGENYLGSIATVTLHICTREPGTKVARAIGKRLLAALGVEILVTGFVTVIGQSLGATYSPDPESAVRGTLQFQYDLYPLN